jgi:hypothetical protein
MIWYFTAHTINCVCHSIGSMFKVVGVYIFDSHLAWGLETCRTFSHFLIHSLQSTLLFKRNLQPPGLKARNMSNPSGRYILCYLHTCLNFGWPQVLNWKGGHLAVFECVGTRSISMQKIDLFRFRFSLTVNKVATPRLKGNQ